MVVGFIRFHLFCNFILIKKVSPARLDSKVDNG